MIRTGIQKFLLGGMVIVFGTFLAVIVSFAAFSEPTAVPPGSNVDAPLNVGVDLQSKDGDLVLIGLITDDLVVSDEAYSIGTLFAETKLAVGNGIADFVTPSDPSDPTSPPIDAPVQALEVWGQIAMRGGAADDTRITNVDSPIDDRDVATKGYVDAQAGGGGSSGEVITVWGVGQQSQFVGTPLPGQGAPACNTLGDSNYAEVFAGYGPHMVYDRVARVDSSGMSQPIMPGDFGGKSYGSATNEDLLAIAYGGDSICSSSQFVAVPTPGSPTGASPNVVFVTASACGQFTAGDIQIMCNTCRVCRRSE